MRIHDNSMAMFLNRWYNINSAAVAKSMQRIASGYRINSAADDPAGLCISEKMRAQIRGLNMAAKNSQDAISLVQTAEGALGEAHSILQRMNELAVQAATGTLQDFDRQAAAKEFEQLKRELNDISAQTNFNNINLLDGSCSYAGYQRSAATAGVNVTRTQLTGQDIPSSGIALTETDYNADKKTPASVTGSVSSVNYGDTISVNGTVFEVVAKASDAGTGNRAVVWDGKSSESFVQSFQTAFEASNEAGNYTFSAGTESSVFSISQKTPQEQGAPSVSYHDNASDGSGYAKQQTTVEFDFSKLAEGDRLQFKVGSTNVDITRTAGMTRTQFFNELSRQLAGEKNVQVKSGAIVAKGVEVSGIEEGFTSGLKNTDTNALRIQVGPLENQQLAISIDAINTASLGLDGINLDDQDAAGRAVTAVRNAVAKVSDQRTTLGAMHNRLEYKISNLKNTSINLADAESRIRDADLAYEMMQLVKHQVLLQATMAMMAQCNSRYQNVLTLLGSL